MWLHELLHSNDKRLIKISGYETEQSSVDNLCFSYLAIVTCRWWDLCQAIKPMLKLCIYCTKHSKNVIVVRHEIHAVTIRVLSYFHITKSKSIILFVFRRNVSMSVGLNNILEFTKYMRTTFVVLPYI